MRGNAQQALIAIGPTAAPDVAEYLKDADPLVSEAAHKILQAYGTGAQAVLPALASGIAGSDPKAQAQSAGTILKIDPNNQPAAQKLIAMLRDNDPQIRRFAAEALMTADAGGWRAVPALIQALHDADPHVREAAAEALGAIGPRAHDAVAALIEAATSAHPPINLGRELIGMDDSIHRAAIEALGNIGAQASPAIPMLTDALGDDRRGNLHSYACKALIRMGPSAAPAVPQLVSLVAGLNERSRDLFQLAAVLKAIGPGASAALPALRDKLGSSNTRTRRAALEAILAIDTSSQTRADVLRLINDPDPNLKELAIKELVKDPVSAAANVPLLISLLKSTNYALRLDSIVGLGNAGPAGAEALPILIDENTGSSYQNNQRELAFAAVKKIDPTGAKTILLLQPLLKKAFKIRGSIELLENIGSPQCLELARATRLQWKMQ